MLSYVEWAIGALEEPAARTPIRVALGDPALDDQAYYEPPLTTHDYCLPTYLLLATCYLLLATCYVLLATCYLLLATCHLPLATYYCTCYLLLTTCYLPLPTLN